MKLWDKGYSINERIESFTVGKDRELDIHLALYDVVGSQAHANMLAKVGLISNEENSQLQGELSKILDAIDKGTFQIQKGMEDVHSQVEFQLTQTLGDTGKKIHLGRSRNDQVLLDLRLFFRDQITQCRLLTAELVKELLDNAQDYKDVLIPGYTHTQVGMVSSFGLWFSAFAEALIDDIEYLNGISKVINRNPLGTAAGYGSSMPLDREQTTQELEFNGLCINPINAQIGRGKTELLVAQGLSSLALTLNKLSTDICLFSNENYKFLSLPKEYTTGSSIMPHKKNPDVFELIRAHTNQFMSLPNQIMTMISNLTSGYHRDFQLQKEAIFPAIFQLKEILRLVKECIPALIIHDSMVYEDQYQFLWSVEEVNHLVQEGHPFRDAYTIVGQAIEDGSYAPKKELQHTHIGSIGNLGLDSMRTRLVSLLDS